VCISLFDELLCLFKLLFTAYLIVSIETENSKYKNVKRLSSAAASNSEFNVARLYCQFLQFLKTVTKDKIYFVLSLPYYVEMKV